MDFSIPELIDQRYRVKDKIGSGAMATVYSAEDTRLGRRVALKVLRPEHASDAVFRARFQREAEAVASLNHPSIVAVYDTGLFSVGDDDNAVEVPYMVMELVEGESLRKVINEQGHLSVADSVAFGSQILDALQYSSEAGIIHRDIKPANVMVLPETEEDKTQNVPGQVKVMDFGIARALEESGEALTKANTVMGTARYISPEQARGETVDARSDIYSAACVIYEMLTGSSPFNADSNVDLAAKHLSETPEAPSTRQSDIPDAVDTVILRALAKSRSDRYQSAEDFSRDLTNAARGVAPLPAHEADPTEATTALTAAGAGAAGVAGGYAAANAADNSPVEETGIGGFFDSAQDDYTDEELFEYERDAARAKKKRRRTAWIRVLTAGLILLLAATSIGIALYYQNELNKVATNAVPAVQNMSKDEAETTMRNLGFGIKYEEEFSDTIEKGKIIKSSPVTGTVLDEGTEVTLTVSKGPAKVAIPSELQGQSEQYVRKTLEDAGFVPGRTSTENSATIPAGMVISVDPEEGSSVDAGSTVNIILSDGKVKVPSLVGLTRDQAVAELSASDVLLNTNIETVQTSSQAAGTVISQSSAAGTTVEQGSTVTIRVATAPTATATAVPSSGTSNSSSSNSGTSNNSSSNSGTSSNSGNSSSNSSSSNSGSSNSAATTAPTAASTGNAAETAPTAAATTAPSAASTSAAKQPSASPTK